MFNFNISTATQPEITIEQAITTLAKSTVLEGIIVDNETRDYFLGRLDAGDSHRFEKTIIKKLGLLEQGVYDALDRITEVTRKMNKW